MYAHTYKPPPPWPQTAFFIAQGLLCYLERLADRSFPALSRRIRVLPRPVKLLGTAAMVHWRGGGRADGQPLCAREEYRRTGGCLRRWADAEQEKHARGPVVRPHVLCGARRSVEEGGRD